jgi:hypothetical protein
MPVIDHNVDLRIPTVDEVKAHIQKHQYAYGVVSGLALAGITSLMMRGVASQPISVAIGDAASDSIGVAGRKVVMRNVSFISANRRGSPSWVVRCLETDEVFTSQRKAAMEMGLRADHLSNHLNQARDNVKGFHFERLCLAG